MSELPESLEALLREITENVNPELGSVIQTLDLRPEWKNLFDEMVKCRDDMQRMTALYDALKRKAWSTVELDTGFYANSMRYNLETKKIDIYRSPLDQ
jgi:hypothetical protein